MKQRWASVAMPWGDDSDLQKVAVVAQRETLASEGCPGQRWRELVRRRETREAMGVSGTEGLGSAGTLELCPLCREGVNIASLTRGSSKSPAHSGSPWLTSGSLSLSGSAGSHYWIRPDCWCELCGLLSPGSLHFR